jgi:hypothetical protein
MLIELEIPPGLFRNGTEYQSAGRYYDADLWRFFEGTQRPVGGWRLRSEDGVSGKARAILTWVDNSNQTWIAVGTNEGLWAYDRAGTRYDITPAGWTDGPANATTGGGYGRGFYGQGFYGTPRPDTTNTIPAMVWTLDVWGENLIACDGRDIYQWEVDTGTPAVLLTNAPEANAIMVTDERIIMALGADGDPRKIEWCDAEDNTVWTPAATNLAGGKLLQTNGRLMCGKRVRGGYLIFTDTDVHLSVFSGLPNVYDFERLASGCGIISQQGVAVVGSDAYWMTPNGFWSYNGAAQSLISDIGDDLFRTINLGQSSKVNAVHNSTFGEIWWFYPSSSSIECDRYVIYNYREGHWNRGVMNRLCGTDKGVLPLPMMVDASGFLYEHEVANFRDGRQPYVVSGPVEIGKGDRTMYIYRIIPDETNLGDVEVSFKTGDWTLSPDSFFGPFPVAADTNCRFAARRAAVRMTADPDIDFRVGRFRFEVLQGGGR